MRMAESASKSVSPLRTIASNTGSVSAGRAADQLEDFGSRGLLMPRLVELAGKLLDIGFLRGSTELRRRAAFGALRLTVLGRCVFGHLPPVLSRRLIASPEAQDWAS